MVRLVQPARRLAAWAAPPRPAPDRRITTKARLGAGGHRMRQDHVPPGLAGENAGCVVEQGSGFGRQAVDCRERPRPQRQCVPGIADPFVQGEVAGLPAGGAGQEVRRCPGPADRRARSGAAVTRQAGVLEGQHGAAHVPGMGDDIDRSDPVAAQDFGAEAGVFPGVADFGSTQRAGVRKSSRRLWSMTRPTGRVWGWVVPPVTRIGRPVRRCSAAAVRSRSRVSRPGRTPRASRRRG